MASCHDVRAGYTEGREYRDNASCVYVALNRTVRGPHLASADSLGRTGRILLLIIAPHGYITRTPPQTPLLAYT